MKKLVSSCLFVIQVFLGFGQANTGLTGKVIDSETHKPLPNVVASVKNTNLMELTDKIGVLNFKEVPSGNQLLEIKTAGYKLQLLEIVITQGTILDLGIIVLEEDFVSEGQSNTISLADIDLNDDNGGSENTVSLLQSSRDVFQQAAAFNWGQARFKIRGIDNAYGTVMINGITMNKAIDGRPQFGNWAGLNDVTKNQEFTFGSAPSDYTFGGLLGMQVINTRASLYKAGNRITTATSNTSYSGRIMATVASGAQNNGWAYVISASKGISNEGYFEGTSRNSNAFFVSVEEKLSEINTVNATVMYSNNRNSKNSPNTKEVSSLAGEKYNSYWGWQDGEKRNSRIKNIEEPLFIVSDYWKITPKTNLNLNVAYQFGKIGNSRIDFQGVDNPDPTYYKNMPSYYTSLYETNPAIVILTDPSAYLPGGLGGIPTPDNVGASNANFLIKNQIDWTSMYQANNVANKEGEGAKYVLYEDRTDDKQLSGNGILSSQLADTILLNAGASFSKVMSHNFKNVLDLLGGNYFNDSNLFGIGQQQQSDLNHPNKQVLVGDSYGYNYNLYTNKMDFFTQFKFTYKKTDFYLAQSFSKTDYQRQGLYKNGYYPTNSFGYSNKITFENFGFKGGFTLKKAKRQFITFNGIYMSKAPTLRNVFNNPRMNNNNMGSVVNESILSWDANYIVNAPKIKARFTAFYTAIKNQTETTFFYGNGAGIDNLATSSNESNAFLAQTLTHINKKNIGLEMGLEYPITVNFKAMTSIAYGQYIYDNNPNLSVTNDAMATDSNTNPILDYGYAYLKNLKQSGTPQSAVSLGLEYRNPKYWYVGANCNYLANNYIDLAPILRTNHFFINPASVNGNPFPEAIQARANQLLRQEKFNNFYLVNLSGGKSWRVGKNILGFFASMNNVFDVLYKTGGFEQARNANYRTLNQDVSSGTPAFAPKYFYGYGRTYFLTIYLNF